jgi:predicted RNase H-like HicB family nuclease
MGVRLSHPRQKLRYAGKFGYNNGQVIWRKTMSTITRQVILHAEEDGGFWVEVPSLPGCISQGDTKDEALANSKEAIEVYIESLRARGEPIPDGSARGLPSR